MFENIGSKIKNLAKVLCWIGIVASVIIAIVLWADGLFIVGFIVLLCGSFFSWIDSYFAYGFGELVEKIDIIEKQNRNNDDSDAELQNESERIEKLNKLRNQNLITEEEYKQILHKEKNKK